MSQDPTLTSGSRSRGSITLKLVLLAAWLTFLFVQHGEPGDEAEHAHVAWLMDHGKRPLIDFFQHHQPLFWDVLRLGFHLGFHGAYVLVWGRILVVLCGVATIVSLLALARRWAPNSNRRWLEGGFGPFALVLLTILFKELFVARPETLSLALSVGALAAWTVLPGSARSAGNLRALTAGLLFGAAVYASPRELTLAGFFLLPERDQRSALRWERWLILGLGAVGFVAGYTLLSGVSLQQALFNIRFSAHLQRIGTDPRGYLPWFPTALAGVCVLTAACLVAGLPRARRNTGVLVLGYLAAIFAAAAWTAGSFRYAQAYSAFVVAVALALTWVESQLPRPSDWQSERATWAALALAGLGVVFATRVVSPPTFDFLADVRTREALAIRIPPGEKVMLFTGHLPIASYDASFYGPPIFDVPDRLCQAVRSYEPPFPLPPCDLMKDFDESKPFFVDASLPSAFLPEVRDSLIRRMEADYHTMKAPKEQAWPRLWKDQVMRRNGPRQGSPRLSGTGN